MIGSANGSLDASVISPTDVGLTIRSRIKIKVSVRTSSQPSSQTHLSSAQAKLPKLLLGTTSSPLFKLIGAAISSISGAPGPEVESSRGRGYSEGGKNLGSSVRRNAADSTP